MEIEQFEQVIKDFSETLDALRDFVSSVSPLVIQKHNKASEAAAEVYAVYKLATYLTSPEEPANSDLPEEVREGIAHMRNALARAPMDFPDEKMQQFASGLSKIVPIKLIDGKLVLSVDNEYAMKFLQNQRAAEKARTQVRLLYESSLMALTSSSEWFIARLVHVFFRKFPNAAGTSEAFFSLQDLEDIGSIPEAKSALLESRVETLMRGPFEDWVAFFKKTPKLGLSYIGQDAAKISEIYKRRNLIVHNGGRVSRKYMESVPQELRGTAKINETIEVGPEYLQQSIDTLEKNFVLLGAELWKKIEPKDDGRGKLLNNLAVDHLKEKRWSVAEGLGVFSLNDKEQPEYSRMCGLINYWQSYKWSDRYELIRDEVEKAEFSAKEPLFKLGRFAILEDYDSFFKLLPRLIEHGELSTETLSEWPIFKEARLRPEMAPHLRKCGDGDDGSCPSIKADPEQQTSPPSN